MDGLVPSLEVIKTVVCACLIVLLSGSVCLAKPSKYRTPEAIVSSLNDRTDFKQLGRVVMQNVSFGKDDHVRHPIDDYKPVLLTLAQGYGDCEDFAMVLQECLSVLGIRDNYLLGVKSPGPGHMVSVFRPEGSSMWYIYSNGEYMRGATTFAGVIKAVARERNYRTVDYWDVKIKIDDNYVYINTPEGRAAFLAQVDSNES